MNSEEKTEKEQLSQDNYRNIKKILLQEQNKDNSDLEKSKMNYFRMMKEIEKEEKSKNHSKQNSKMGYKSLTEKIYSNNSAKLGDYYNKNQNDLLLYGSKKYDLFSIQRVVKEMDKYKKKVLTKIKENKKSPNPCKNYDFENCDEKFILTPLAEPEKEKNEMEKLEKKKFDEAERLGVVMRRIEYTHLLDHRDSFRNSLEEERRLLLLMKNSIDTIEKNYLRYRNNKNFLKSQKNKKEENKENDNTKNDDNNNIVLDKNKRLDLLNNYIIQQFYFEVLGENENENIIYQIYKTKKDVIYLKYIKLRKKMIKRKMKNI